MTKHKGPVVEEQPELGNGTANLVRRQAEELAQWAPALVRSVDEAVEQVKMRNEFMSRVMRTGIDYGPQPGVADSKNVLYKPGAENLLANMGLHATFPRDELIVTEDWTGQAHNGETFIGYIAECRVYRQTGLEENQRMLVAAAHGSCNSFEVKYRYRQGKRACPECGQATIIKGKEEYGGGWVCFKKQGGCGSKFDADDKRITAQETGRINNPDIADVANTLLKMAEKRALIATTLLATGFSDLLTQDVGDDPLEELRADIAGKLLGLDEAGKQAVSAAFGKPLSPRLLKETKGNLLYTLHKIVNAVAESTERGEVFEGKAEEVKVNPPRMVDPATGEITDADDADVDADAVVAALEGKQA